jgi:hypothetical protein
MDLPKSNYYGVRCPNCPAVYWHRNQSQIELMCTVSFEDRGLPLVPEHFGIVVGFGRFKHVCKPELEE